MCKKIHRGGNAEQYNADKKYKEAVAEAVEACAEDVKGQTCFICTQALHWKTKEGLVRGCACRGTAGVAHVSCLAEQAKILFEEAEENNLGDKVCNERWKRWYTCGLCEQKYHGVVSCALGWACWKTYVGRPEDQTHLMAMSVLGNGLTGTNRYEDALSVQESELSMLRRFGASEHSILAVQNNLASTYQSLGRIEEAVSVKRDVYLGRLKLNGEEHEGTLRAAFNYVNSLEDLKRVEEAKTLLRKMIPVARRVLGNSHPISLGNRWFYARMLCQDANATLDDLREAVTTLEETDRIARRVLGGSHPLTKSIEDDLQNARAALNSSEAPPAGIG
jgi:hypothetical protein